MVQKVKQKMIKHPKETIYYHKKKNQTGQTKHTF